MTSVKTIGQFTWEGTWKKGSGIISTPSSTLKEAPYSFSSWFEGTPGASPEELLAAAEAGCFNQALANNFGMIGFEAEKIDTLVTVELGQGSDEFPAILAVSITTEAKVPGILQERFEYCAERARVHCTIGKSTKVEIDLKTVREDLCLLSVNAIFDLIPLESYGLLVMVFEVSNVRRYSMIPKSCFETFLFSNF